MSLAEDYQTEYSQEHDCNIERSSTMQIQGTVDSVVATPQPGGYQSQGGWIYTFIMTVNGQSGEIGCKTQQCPYLPGTQIIVEVTQGQQGTKFKRINPQYAQQNQQQPQQQQAPPQQSYTPPARQDQNTYTPPPQTPPRNDVQGRIQFAQALNLVCQDRCYNLIDEPQMAAKHREYLTILQSEKFPITMQSQGMPTQNPQPVDTTDYSQEEPIPF